MFRTFYDDFGENWNENLSKNEYWKFVICKLNICFTVLTRSEEETERFTLKWGKLKF